MEISVATRVLRGFHATLWCLARKYRALSKGNPLTVAHTAALESAACLLSIRYSTCRASFRYRNPDISSGSQTVSTSVC
jgi:hypothetical protein